ncbi:putative MscS family protein YkuT [Caulifigura coniformis]|uniref:Putative MscS family protein YkuT n=1 Tax=Caulifigura coniformis TaxID=2527983 RepID=A0A517SI34_9PLAN|nr:mechanosensitive ion channel family protein [Caulifigura coniformis]QDT55784.1 putative MscS family protein YkuT [Caulifigura coniformis]
MTLSRVLLCLLVLSQGHHASAGQLKTESKEAPATAANSATSGQTQPTTAERIAGLERLLTADRQRQADLRRLSEELQQDFEARSAEFTTKDSLVTETRAGMEAATEEELKVRRPALEKLEKEREAARAQFDRTISRRKAVQEQLEILTEKIALEEKGLERLKSAEPEASSQPSPRSRPPKAAPDGQPAADANAAGPEESKSPSNTAADRPAAEALAPGAKANAADQKEESNPAPAVEAEPVLAAKRELQSRRRELDLANERVQELDESIAIFERDLQSAERLLDITRQEAESATKTVQEQRRELEQRRSDGTPEAETSSLEEALAREAGRVEATRAEIAFQRTRVDESRVLLERLRESRSLAGKELEGAAQSLKSAEAKLALLESPVAPHRIGGWIRNTGPRVLGLVLLLLVIWWAGQIVARRVIGTLMRRSRHGSSAEREQRAETLQRVFRYAVSMAVLTLGVLAVLHTSGIDVSVLFGGAAVIGAAVAFGSQNLIKDYFTGFMILAENQYSVGNVIRIADTSGVVEDISLRMTVLRDEEGTVHFIPHGQVTKVSNMTHGWSRAVFQIPVGYQENIDEVMTLLLDLAKQMRDDPKYGPQTLGQPEMQGVDALGDSAVLVKFTIKTRPHMQWGVKREMLRRIKTEFDRRGIVIPYPQWVVHHADGEPEASDSAARESVP